MASLDQCLSMAAYLAFVEVREFRMSNPQLSILEAVESVKNVRAKAIGLDYEKAKILYKFLDQEVHWNQTTEGIRHFVFQWVQLVQPFWIRFVPHGRERVKNALIRDQEQCFRVAGLLDMEPEEEVILWWDRLADYVRGETENEKMKRARFAERLSIELERKRLARLNIDLAPKWVSLEDNSLGYDILSYDKIEGRIVNRLIEVKSTLGKSIVLTRGEWNNAVTAPDKTLFHIWRLPEQTFEEVSVSELSAHIPVDSGNGSWRNVEINLNLANL